MEVLTRNGNAVLWQNIDGTRQVWNYSFTGTIISNTFPAGTYVLECWGAGAGRSQVACGCNNGVESGRGGYSRGIIVLTASTQLFVCVGGYQHFPTILSNNGVHPGGFNGGGIGIRRFGGGGGATHIARQGGLLTSLANLPERNNILLVAGGGGGGCLAYTGGRMGCGGGLSGVSPPAVQVGLFENDWPRLSSAQGSGGTQTGGGLINAIPPTGAISWPSPGTSSPAGQPGSGTNGTFGQGGRSLHVTPEGRGGGGGGFFGGGPGGGASVHGGVGAGGVGMGGGGSSFINTNQAGQGPIIANGVTNGMTIAGDERILDSAGNITTGNQHHGSARITRIINTTLQVLKRDIHPVLLPPTGGRVTNSVYWEPLQEGHPISIILSRNGNVVSWSPSSFIVLEILTHSIGDRPRNVPMSITLQRTTVLGTAAWSVMPGSTLPAGLSLNGTTGVLSGTPTVPGTYNFIIQLTMGSQTAIRGFAGHIL